jgi:hypothetical protein
MIKSLTVVYVTARHEPKIEWFFESLHRETGKDYSNTKIIVIDTFWEQRTKIYCPIINVKYRTPKPSIWQGEHRITKEDWWAKCNALNTGICLCDTEWIAFVDDRSVLSHGWLQCVQDSMIHEYAVCGSYEKRSGMKVENGEITDPGELLGQDIRTQRGFPHRTTDWYGGSGALPLEWCLLVNGFPEDICDGLGFEDIAFGILLRNNNLDMRYDSRMRIIEDRTPTEIDGALKRASKPSPNEDKYQAKDYRILSIMGESKVSGNSYDIRELRQKVLRGEPWPVPSASHTDWFDGQPISEME